jgi:hypothetical protein
MKFIPWIPDKKELEGYTPKERTILNILLFITALEAIPLLLDVVINIFFLGVVIGIRNFFVLIITYLKLPLTFLLLACFGCSISLVGTMIIAKYFFKKKLGSVESKLIKIHLIYVLYLFVSGLLFISVIATRYYETLE